MKTISLNGEWTLHAVEKRALTPDELPLTKCFSIPCTVPGNVELDLARAGYLPEDIFFGTNLLKAQEYEGYEWWYETEFDTPKTEENEILLCFEGVDCLAEYWLNGVKIGETENAFIPHEFSVASYLKANGKNKLFISVNQFSKPAL